MVNIRSGYKRWLGFVILTFACLCVAVYLINAMGTFKRNQRTIVCNPITQTVKAAAGSSIVFADYRVRNLSSKELRLGQPILSCGCSSASISLSIIGPGEESVIKLEGHTPDFGSKRVTVVVPTDKPDVPSISLEFIMVSSAVLPYLVIQGGPINFGKVLSVPSSSQLVIETHEASRSQPWLQTPLSEFAGIEILGALKDEIPMETGVMLRRYEYTVTLQHLPPPGPFRGYLVVISKDTSKEEPRSITEIPILGSVPTTLTVSPSHLYAHLDDAGVCGPIIFLVAHADGKVVEIEPSADVLEEFECKLDRQTGTTRIELRQKHPFHLGVRKTLKFKTNVQQFETLEVPLMLKKDS